MQSRFAWGYCGTSGVSISSERAARRLPRSGKGLCGKLPARGHFGGADLSRQFGDSWHGRGMSWGSRARLGGGWVPAWLEAADWRFVLSPGQCGLDAAMGLWMPSIDCVGGQFPLTLTARAPGNDPRALNGQGDEILGLGKCVRTDALEPIGIGTAPLAKPGSGEAGGELRQTELALVLAVWWTEEAPRFPAATIARALSDGAIFAGILGVRPSVPRLGPSGFL